MIQKRAFKRFYFQDLTRNEHLGVNLFESARPKAFKNQFLRQGRKQVNPFYSLKAHYHVCFWVIFLLNIYSE